MRAEGKGEYRRYLDGFAEGYPIGLAEPISSEHGYGPRVAAILDYEGDRRRLLYRTPEGRATLEAEAKRAQQQAPYAGPGAATAGAAQGQVTFSTASFAATGVLDSSREQGVADGIQQGLKLHGTRGMVRERELRDMAQAAWQDHVRGKWRIEPDEWPHYWAGYQAGFAEAWSHQGRTGGGQNLEGALRERARRSLLNMTDAGQQVLKREERARGR
jgi:hypothetical protein